MPIHPLVFASLMVLTLSACATARRHSLKEVIAVGQRWASQNHLKYVDVNAINFAEES